MLKSIFRKLMGGGAATAAAGTSGDAPAKSQSAVASGEANLTGFVDYVARNLVDCPEDVDIAHDVSNECLMIKVKCRKSDIGKIIGKNGKTINAIRSLVQGAAVRLNKKVNVEILE
jgi:hypothetical protein